jgi:hypothetical protein
MRWFLGRLLSDLYWSVRGCSRENLGYPCHRWQPGGCEVAGGTPRGLCNSYSPLVEVSKFNYWT